MSGDVDYHSRRATEELQLSLGAASPNAARAHLDLSALHSARIAALKAMPRGSSHSSSAARVRRP